MKKLAIHLVTWNGEKYIQSLFDSLVAQTYKDFTVYVWDNNSEDATVAKIQKYQDLLDIDITVNSENINFDGGHNELYQKSKEGLLLVLNQDTYFEDTCLEKLVAAAEDRHIGALAPRIMQWDKKTVDSLGLQVHRSRRVVERGQGEQWQELRRGYNSVVTPVFGVSAAIALYRREALDMVAFSKSEFFDSLYTFYKEDVDLAYRLQSAGWDAAVHIDAVAYHDRTTGGGKQMGDLAAAKGKNKQSKDVRYYSYRNHILTLLKNLYIQNYILDGIWIEWYEAKKLVYGLLFDRQIMKALVEIIKMRKQIAEKRQFIISKRKRDWKEFREQLYL